MKCTHIRVVLSKHCIFNLYIQHVNFIVNTSESESGSVYVSTTLEYLKENKLLHHIVSFFFSIA